MKKRTATLLPLSDKARDDVVAVLTGALILIGGNGCWTQYAYAHARTDTARPVYPTDGDAGSFDICGAVMRSMAEAGLTGPRSAAIRGHAYAALCSVLPPRHRRTSRDTSLAQLLRFNDAPETDHEHIVELFETALAAFEDAEKKVAA